MATVDDKTNEQGDELPKVFSKATLPHIKRRALPLKL